VLTNIKYAVDMQKLTFNVTPNPLEKKGAMSSVLKTCFHNVGQIQNVASFNSETNYMIGLPW